MVKTQTIKDIQFCLLHLTTNDPDQHKEIKEEIKGLWLPKQENKKLKSFFEKASDDFILIKVFNYRSFLKTHGFSILSIGSEDTLQSVYCGSDFAILNYKTEENFLKNVQYTLNQLEFGVPIPGMDCYIAFFILHGQCFVISLDKDGKAIISDINSYTVKLKENNEC